MSPARSRLLLAIGLPVAVAGTFGLAALVSSRVFENPRRTPPPRPALPAPAALPAPELFRIAALEGTVEVLHGGRWFPVQAGDQLAREDVIRTARGARVLLRRGASEIEVKENVDIRADRLADETATFELVRGGNVSASVASDRESLEIAAQQTRTVNEGRARWVVQVGPEGRVSVAASKGAVRFGAAGQTVRVEAGAESTAAPGEAPSSPTPIPEELLLSVIWPERATAQATAEVKGQVAPSTRLTVNGDPVETTKEGAFRAQVPLQPGTNRVLLEAEDIAGRKRSASGTVRREGKAPALERADEEIWRP